MLCEVSSLTPFAYHEDRLSRRQDSKTRPVFPTSIITTGLSELRSDTRITFTKSVRDAPYPLELSARLEGCPPRARVRQFSLVPLRHFCRLSSPRPFKR